MPRFKLNMSAQLALILVSVVMGMQGLFIWVDRVNQLYDARQIPKAQAPNTLAASLAVLQRQDVNVWPAAVRTLSTRRVQTYVRPVPGLHPTDKRDAALERQTKNWLIQNGFPVAEIRVAERVFKESKKTPPTGIASERAPILAVGAAPRNALMHDHLRVSPWVTGDWSAMDPTGTIPSTSDPETGPPRTAPENRPPRLPPPHVRTAHAEVYTFAVRLEGMDVWVSQYSVMKTPPWNVSIAKLWMSLLGAGLLAGGALLLGRRVMAPLRDLAQSADALGRGEQGATLAVRGPSDTREIITAFNQMNQRVNQSVDYQIGLLQSLGHDLKGSLASVDMLVDGVEPVATRTLITSRLGRVQDILNSIMGFSRAVMRDGSLEVVNLAAMVQSVVDEQADLGAHATVETPQGVMMRCRINAVERALRNLVENAIKHGGSAHTALHVEGDEAVITVDDDGPGLPQGQLETVFQPFFQGTEDSTGTGLGLAIARTIAVDHGGSVTLSNRSGGGLRAELRLPLAMGDA
ncbi:MAG: HAMP domain-containing sensor histidine kinase [Pseudomonadota bacterium]